MLHHRCDLCGKERAIHGTGLKTDNPWENSNGTSSFTEKQVRYCRTCEKVYEKALLEIDIHLGNISAVARMLTGIFMEKTLKNQPWENESKELVPITELIDAIKVELVKQLVGGDNYQPPKGQPVFHNYRGGKK